MFYVLVGSHGRWQTRIFRHDHEWQRALRILQGWTWIMMGAGALLTVSFIGLAEALVTPQR
jgi:hypothetical protein